MGKLKLGRAFQLVMRTLPLNLVRLGAYLAFSVVALIYFGVVGGLAFLLGKIWNVLGVIVFLAGIGVAFPLYNLAKKYVFYIIKAAQVAVYAEMLEHGDLPASVNQLEWGKQQVTARFGEVSAMFVVDELVTAALRMFTNTVSRLANWLPGDLFRNLASIINRVVRYAVGYIDEAVLARTFWRKEGGVWANARDGVVLYGMVWKPLLLNAVGLMVLSYAVFILVLVLLVAPIGGLARWIFGPAAGGWGVLVALFIAYLLKVAIGDGFAMAAMIAAYHDETAGLLPDPQMTARIEQVSDKFREITGRAAQEVAAPLATQPLATDPAQGWLGAAGPGPAYGTAPLPPAETPGDDTPPHNTAEA